MAVAEFPDGIKIGPDSLPVYMMDEWVTDEIIDLATMSANELRTLVFNNVETVRGGAKIFAAPQTPSYYPNLQVRHAWLSDVNQVSVLVKNDSDSEVVYGLSEQWILSYWNTSAPPAP